MHCVRLPLSPPDLLIHTADHSHPENSKSLWVWMQKLKEQEWIFLTWEQKTPLPLLHLGVSFAGGALRGSTPLVPGNVFSPGAVPSVFSVASLTTDKQAWNDHSPTLHLFYWICTPPRALYWGDTSMKPAPDILVWAPFIWPRHTLYLYFAFC